MSNMLRVKRRAKARRARRRRQYAAFNKFCNGLRTDMHSLLAHLDPVGTPYFDMIRRKEQSK